ncbi:MAG: LytTR family transcriptional regulator DNA-binding domain-containing protein [Clostridia bacterium]|nr:LytTR family transcriptional regulator DNA-binding domain-containing protein [Clostridia bacterium]
MFAQPHSSFLVNLCYVEEVTKDFVRMKHKAKDYSVYTSSRKLNSFKNAFLKFNNAHI